MASSEVLLWLLVSSLVSAAVTLNPDDPNVCSHWERSVPSPITDAGGGGLASGGGGSIGRRRGSVLMLVVTLLRCYRSNGSCFLFSEIVSGAILKSVTCHLSPQLRRDRPGVLRAPLRPGLLHPLHRHPQLVQVHQTQVGHGFLPTVQA